MRRSERNKAKILTLLAENPLVEQACRKAGVARSTFYRWSQSDRKFHYQSEAARLRGREKLNDFAESKLLENIKDSQQRAIEYWLDNNSKHYQSSRRMHRREYTEQLKQDELAKNKEIAEIFDLKETIEMLGGDYEVIEKAIHASLRGKYKWLVLNDQDEADEKVV